MAANKHQHIKFGMSEVKELVNTRVVNAVIIEIDMENNTADIETNRWGRVDDVPFFFHCGGEETVDHGHEAFYEDDPVLVMCINQRENPDSVPTMKIVAHAEKLYPCYGYLVIQVGECFTIWDVHNQEIPDAIIMNEGTETETRIAFPCSREEIQPWLESMTRTTTLSAIEGDENLYISQFDHEGTFGPIRIRPDCNVPHVWTWDPSSRQIAYDPPCHSMVCILDDGDDWDCEFSWFATGNDYCPGKGGFATVHATEGYEEVDAFTNMATNWGFSWNMAFLRENDNSITERCITQFREWQRTEWQTGTNLLSVQHEIQTPLRLANGDQGVIQLPWDDIMTHGENSLIHNYNGYLCANSRIDYHESLRTSRLSLYAPWISGYPNIIVAYEDFHSTQDISKPIYDKVMGVTYFVPISRKQGTSDDTNDHRWMNVAQIYLVETFYISGTITAEFPVSEPCPYPTSNVHTHEVKVLAACESISGNERLSGYNPFAQVNNADLVAGIQNLYAFAREFHAVQSDMLGPSEWIPPSDEISCMHVQGCVWNEFVTNDPGQYHNVESCEQAGFAWNTYYNECRLPSDKTACEAVGAIWNGYSCKWPGECSLPENKTACEASGNIWNDEEEKCVFNPHNSYLHMNIGFAPFGTIQEVHDFGSYKIVTGFAYGLRQARSEND